MVKGPKASYKHRIYVEKSFVDGAPAAFWDFPEDFHSNPDAYVTQTLIFRNYMDRTKEQIVNVYALTNYGVTTSVSHTMPHVTNVEGQKIIVLSLVAPPLMRNNVYNQIECARRYQHLPACAVAEVANLENQIARAQDEMRRLNTRLYRLQETTQISIDKIADLVLTNDETTATSSAVDDAAETVN